MGVVTASYTSIAASDLQGYYKLDETAGTLLYDSSGNERNLTLKGAYDFTTDSHRGNAINFTGGPGYANASSNSIFSYTNETHFSYCAWSKPNSWAGINANALYSAIMGKFKSGENGYSVLFYIKSTQLATYSRTYSAGGDSNHALNTGTSAYASYWRFICSTWDAFNTSVIMVWRSDDVLYTDTKETAGVQTIANTGIFSIGGMTTTPRHAANQTLDDIMVFNKTLTLAEFKELAYCQAPSNSWSTWKVKTNCTMNNEEDITTATMFIEAGEKYTLINSNLTIGHLNSRGSFNIGGGSRLVIK